MADQDLDYYALLGIGRGATAVEVERAYRRAARATHPDINPDDDSAAERFNAVTVAYETLRSPEQRASYDRARAPVRSTRVSAEPAAGDLFDVFAVLTRLLRTWP